MHPTSVLVTLTGHDRPGVTATLFASFAAHDVEVRDVEQVVIRERVILAALLDLRGDPGALRHSIEQTAEALGMRCDVVTADHRKDFGARHRRGAQRHHVTLLGHPIRPGAVSHIASQVAEAGANIESIVQLSNEPTSCVEMLVSALDPARLRAALVEAADQTGLDIAVELEALRRRAKRLVFLDLDVTLIRDEAIDMLAERAGVLPELDEVGRRSASGELDLAQCRLAQVALLGGVPLSVVREVRDRLRLAPGAATLVRTLQRLGYRVGVVSDSFTAFTDRFVTELGLDFAAANELEVDGDRLTGRLVGGPVDAAGKADALLRFADRTSVPLPQTVAIGEGPNDLEMVEMAGLGVAFTGKTAIRHGADRLPSRRYLDPVMHVLGIDHADLAE